MSEGLILFWFQKFVRSHYWRANFRKQHSQNPSWIWWLSPAPHWTPLRRPPALRRLYFGCIAEVYCGIKMRGKDPNEQNTIFDWNYIIKAQEGHFEFFGTVLWQNFMIPTVSNLRLRYFFAGYGNKLPVVIYPLKYIWRVSRWLNCYHLQK